MTTDSALHRGTPTTSPRRRLLAILTGLIVAIVVAAVGAFLLLARPAEYRASTTLVVLPDSENVEAASYYDTLSQGQITATFADILRLRAGQADLAGGSASDVVVDVLPDTSLIQITVTAADAATAEADADAVLVQVQPYFDQLTWPYDVFVVDTAAGSAERSGFSPSLLTAVVAALAMVAGVAAYLAVRTVQQARRQVTAQPAPVERESVDNQVREGTAAGPAWPTAAGSGPERDGDAVEPRTDRSAVNALPSQSAR